MALNDDKKAALTKKIQKQKYLESLESDRAHIDRKIQYGNLTRYMNIQRRELEEEAELQKVREEAALRERRLQEENNIAKELDNIKRKEIKELRLRQQLRENSHELRDLERKLKAAYTNKELVAQMAQKEAEKLNNKILEHKNEEILQMAIVEEAELKRRDAEEEIIKKAQYKQELQDQIILKEKSKRSLYEEFLREKKMLDDIIQRIHDEDEREIVERMSKMQKTREEMVAFKEAQEMWKKRKREEIEEETRKIQEFLLAKGTEIEKRMHEKKRKAELKEQIQESMAKQLFVDKMKQKEREEIIQEIMLEEQKEAVEKRHKADIEKQIRQRLDTRESLFAQMAERQERLREEATEDAKYKEQLLKKLAEDEKLEQMSAQKKRMKMLQLRRDVEQMMIERRQRKAEEMQLDIKLKEQEEKELEERQRIVEEERLRMLKEHVKNLIGYLPKGLLRPDDLPHLGSDIVES